MKVSLIAAISADGYIARAHDELANWTSKEDKRLFVALTKQAGTVVMGGRTFRTIGRPLPGRRNIVYSNQQVPGQGVEVTQESPAQLITRLSGEGVSALAVCGGRTIYDMFLTAGVVDELYLTIEPVLFGRGLNLAATSLQQSLCLVSYRLLNKDTMLMRYEVAR